MTTPDLFTEAAIVALLKDPGKVESILGDLEKLNFQGLVAAFRAGDTDEILRNTANFAAFLSLFIPEATFVADGLQLALFVNQEREAGLWEPDDGTSAADIARDAHDHRSGGR